MRRAGTALRRQDGRLSGEATGHEGGEDAVAAKGADLCAPGPIPGREVARHVGAARAHPSALRRRHHRDAMAEAEERGAAILSGTHLHIEANEMEVAEVEEVQAIVPMAAAVPNIVAGARIADDSFLIRSPHVLKLLPSPRPRS